MRILVYQDYVHNTGTLLRRLGEKFGSENIAYTDASEITSGSLNKTFVLVIPGGADLYYCEKLNGEGNRRIRNFVERGGAYLGICAGAYYGCSALEWAKDTRDEISGKRELALFSGTARGPVNEFIEDSDVRKSWDAAAEIIRPDGASATVYYAGGPVFEDNGQAEVLARYASLPGQPPAIIACGIGRGMAVLCSPHLEYDADSLRRSYYDHRNPSPEWQKNVIEKIEASSEDARKTVWEDMLARLGDHYERQTGKVAA